MSDVLIYNDKNSSYEELLTKDSYKNPSYEKLLTKDGSVSIHHRSIQTLVTNFTRLKMDFCQNFTLKILLVKQSLIIIQGSAMTSEYLQFVHSYSLPR